MKNNLNRLPKKVSLKKRFFFRKFLLVRLVHVLVGIIQKQIVESKKISQAENETFQLDVKFKKFKSFKMSFKKFFIAFQLNTTISEKEAVLEQIRSEREIGAVLKTTEQENQMKLGKKNF